MKLSFDEWLRTLYADLDAERVLADDLAAALTIATTDRYGRTKILATNEETETVRSALARYREARQR